MVQIAPKNYDDAVQALAQAHANELEAGVTIFSLRDPHLQIVRLLEVTRETLPSGSVDPIPLGPSRTFPFRSLIAQITPSEWEGVRKGEILLPQGWALDDLRQVWPNP